MFDFTIHEGTCYASYSQEYCIACATQVLPQRPAPPPQWPPFEVAPTPPRSLSQPAPDLDLLSESSVAGGHGSRYPNSAIVVACTLTVTVALLLAAAYTCSKYFDAKRSSVDATQVRSALGARCADSSVQQFLSVFM